MKIVSRLLLSLHQHHPAVPQTRYHFSIPNVFPFLAAFSSTEAPHNQTIASRNAQTIRMPSTTLTNTAQLIMIPTPATAYNNAQVPPPLATLSRSNSVTQVSQTTKSSSNQTLNSGTVKDSKTFRPLLYFYQQYPIISRFLWQLHQQYPTVLQFLQYLCQLR